MARQVKQSNCNILIRGKVEKGDHFGDGLTLRDSSGGINYGPEVVADYVKDFLYNAQNWNVEISCKRLDKKGISGRERSYTEKIWHNAFEAGKHSVLLDLWAVKNGFETHLDEDTKEFYEGLGVPRRLNHFEEGVMKEGKIKKKENVEKLTEEDYFVEKEWHGLHRIPCVNKMESFKGAFDRRENFDTSMWDI